MERNDIGAFPKPGSGVLDGEQVLDVTGKRYLDRRNSRANPRAPDERPASYHRLEQTRRGQLLVGQPHGVAIDTKIAGKSPDRGQSAARRQLPRLDLGSDVVGNLPVDR